MKNFNLDAILEAMLKISDRVSDPNFSVGRPPQVEDDDLAQAVPSCSFPLTCRTHQVVAPAGPPPITTTSTIRPSPSAISHRP